MKEGIFDGIANEEYHKKHALSKSGLANLAKSPYHYQWCLQNPKEPTPVMLLGTHAHTKILEPEKHRKKYVVAPDVGDKRNKDNKAKWEAFLESSKDKTIVTQDEMDLVNGMALSICESELATKLLSGGIAEQSVFWKHPVYGFDCQCRPDYLNPKYKAIVELKTTADCSPDKVQRAILNFKYHWQDYHYRSGMDIVATGEYETFVFIFVESKPPHSIAIRVLDEGWRFGAELETEPLYREYSECLEKDKWPKPPDEIGVIEPPKWYINNLALHD